MCLNIKQQENIQQNENSLQTKQKTKQTTSLIFVFFYPGCISHIIKLLTCIQDIHGRKSVRGPAHVGFDRGERPFW